MRKIDSVVKTRLKPPIAFLGIPKTFTVYGKSFYNITNVYVSGAPFNGRTTLFNPFSAVAKLSATFPAFTGLKLLSSSYSVESPTTMTFTMPSAEFPGFVDVILQNPAGYGSVVKYAIKGNYNPYPVNSPEYSSFQPYVRPWAKGIKVEYDPEASSIVTIEDQIIILTIAGEDIVTINQ